MDVVFRVTSGPDPPNVSVTQQSSSYVMQLSISFHNISSMSVLLQAKSTDSDFSSLAGLSEPEGWLAYMSKCPMWHFLMIVTHLEIGRAHV